jgi:K+-transporting ATPase ATPase C chain
LIGQQFDRPEYFWGRLSATNPPYNAAASSGSNLGPLNPVLKENMKTRMLALTSFDRNLLHIPVDLVTSSASGLDPHISPAAAFVQIARVSKARGLPEETVRAIVENNTTGRIFGLLGEPVVNVLTLNLELDAIKK